MRARSAELHEAWWRASNNLGVLLGDCEQHLEVLVLFDEVEAWARQRGDREPLAAARLTLISDLVELGRWQEALVVRQALPGRGARSRTRARRPRQSRRAAHPRGQPAARPAHALAAGPAPPFHARLDARRGNHDQVDRNYREAETILRDRGLAFNHAVTQLEHAEWLTARNERAKHSHSSPRHARPSSNSKRNPGSNDSQRPKRPRRPSLPSEPAASERLRRRS